MTMRAHLVIDAYHNGLRGIVNEFFRSESRNMSSPDAHLECAFLVPGAESLDCYDVMSSLFSS